MYARSSYEVGPLKKFHSVTIKDDVKRPLGINIALQPYMITRHGAERILFYNRQSKKKYIISRYRSSSSTDFVI